MSRPTLTLDQARWAAHLARLALSDAELAQLTPQLASIVDFVAQLQQLDTSGAEPLAHPHEAVGVFRDDVPSSSLPSEQALEQSPGRTGPYHSVPAALE